MWKACGPTLQEERLWNAGCCHFLDAHQNYMIKPWCWRTTNFSHGTQRNQAGTEKEISSLPVSIHRAWRCYAGSWDRGINSLGRHWTWIVWYQLSRQDISIGARAAWLCWGDQLLCDWDLRQFPQERIHAWSCKLNQRFTSSEIMGPTSTTVVLSNNLSSRDIFKEQLASV